jgi:anaerobic magnesium-protoporphyrin IX monomethyl ester cyclase
LGLYYLSEALEMNGISTSILDFKASLPSRSTFREYLRSQRPRVVGITSFTFNFSNAMQILQEVKRVVPDVVTVMGGVHASALTKNILESTSSLDYIVMGEGELTFLELCENLLSGLPVEDVKGLAYRKKETVLNPSRGFMDDLDRLPIPKRDQLPGENYPIASVQTSRGCPYGCIFCAINKFYENRIRLRDPVKVADECEYLINKCNRKQIYFFGDAFTYKSSWVEELCDEILRRRLKFHWACETRVDKVDLSMLRKMKRAGCASVQYGIDYGDEEVLRRLGKAISLESVDDAVRWAKKADLFVEAFFIFNCPGENEDTMENTFNLIQKTPVDAVEFNLLTPYPGTSLWDNMDKFRMRIVNRDFDYFTTKKYVMENLDFPRRKFVPAFRRLLKRMNLFSNPDYTPEIFDFLKKDIKLRAFA